MSSIYNDYSTPMTTSKDYFFIHAVFKMENMEVDNLLYYNHPPDFVQAIYEKMQEINDSIYRNYPGAYINTSHHVLSGDEKEIILNWDKTTSGKSQFSSEELWQIINMHMKDLKVKSTSGKSVIDKLQTLLRLFNKFISTITANSVGQNKDSLKVVIKASSLDQFALYFVDFLLGKAYSDGDFVSEKIQPYIDSLLSLRNHVDLASISKNTFQLEQFWGWVHFYKSLQELTDQWVDYQVN